MPLTDRAVRQAKPANKAYKLFDERGLYLEVAPNGGRWWRLKYRTGGRERRLALGVYPDVSLKQARKQRDDARALLANGIDPAEKRKADKAAREAERDTLERVAGQWLEAQDWASNYGEKVAGRLRRYIYPLLGHRPLAEITASELLDALRRIERGGNVETAHRVKQHVARIYRFAIASGKATHNPAEGLNEALTTKPRAQHFGAITDPQALGALLRAIEAYDGTPAVKAALQIAPLLLARPGELRRMEWAEIDREAALWSIPADKMKMREPHLVPLPRQALAIIDELEPWTGRGRYVFPSGRTSDRPMSENALGAALRRMGYEQGEVTAHGFRATARTLLDESLGFRPDYIEHQLAHAVRDPNGRAYNRTTFLDERRAMLQTWADYLDSLRDGGNVVAMRAGA